jgi:predicted MFS family arabinose efflux permease
MSKVIGVICIIVSVLLFVKGHDVATSFASRVKQAVQGVPVDAAMKLYAAAGIAGLVGVVLIFWKK